MDEAFLSRSLLCRRIEALGVKDPKRRSARLLQRMLADSGKPTIVRLAAARTLWRWDPALAQPVADKIVTSRWEDPLLRQRLRELTPRPN